MDFDMIGEEDVVLNSMPTSAELEKADSPFQFVAPPEPAEQGKLHSSAPISHDEVSKSQTASLLPPTKDEPDVSPLSTRPNTSQSTISDAKETASKPLQPVQDDDSDSDITEPLPSDHSDTEEPVKKPARKSPVKEMAKKLTIDKRKTAAESGTKASRKSPIKEDEMQVDEEEVVRPPKKKKLLRKLEAEKTSIKTKPAQKPKKQETDEEERAQSSAKKALKSKLKAAKSGDDATPKQRPSFGGLPSFRTKKQVDQAKEAAVQKAQEEAAKPVERPPTSAAPLPAQEAAASEALAPASQASALDSLFDLPAPPKLVAEKDTPMSSVVESSLKVTMEVEEQPVAPQGQNSAAADVSIAPDNDSMQVDKQSEQPETPAAAPAAPAEGAAQVAPVSEALEKPVAQPAPAAPAVRRVSFQAYKKRVSTAPAASAVSEPIAEEPATTTSPTMQSPSDPVKSPVLSVKPEMTSEALLGGDIVQTPTAEKSKAEVEQIIPKSEADSTKTAAPASPVTVQASPAPGQASLPGASAAPAPKARLSFAAYRQRATTAPKPLPVAASPAAPAAKPLVGSTPPAPAPAALQATNVFQAEEPVKELAKESATEPALTPVEKPAQLSTVSQEARTQSKSEPPAGGKEVEMKRDEDEQEEGELFVDPNLEPGEVETESALPANASSTALGMRMGEVSLTSFIRSRLYLIICLPQLQQPEASSSRTQPIKQSYTPPSRHRSLTPPKPALTRQTEDKHNADGHLNQSSTLRSANPDKDQSAPSSNANWAPLGRDRPVSPVASTDKSLPESSRYSANGTSPPTHPRGFSKVSPRNTFNAPLPASKPPTGPRNATAPWPARGRANSAAGSVPGGRGAASGDPIYGGGFGTAGSGGSSYRPASGGRSDGPPPPPPRSSQPPSGPRALQSSNSYLAPRGRGRHEGELL